MMTFAVLLTGVWLVQLLLMWHQANNFRRSVAAMTPKGRVVTGMHRKRGLRTFVAIAISDGIVTDAQCLKGFTVFARAATTSELIGVSVTDLAEGRVNAATARVTAAAVHAANLYVNHTKHPDTAPAVR